MYNLVCLFGQRAPLPQPLETTAPHRIRCQEGHVFKNIDRDIYIYLRKLGQRNRCRRVIHLFIKD